MRLKTIFLFLLAVSIMAAGSNRAGAQNQAKPQKSNAVANPQEQKAAEKRSPDVHFVPTPPEVVDQMLKMANVKKDDVLYDLGSGDGRIPIAAAKQFGVRAVGIDIDPERIKEAEQNAQTAGVSKLVKFRNEDLFTANISEATVVTLYLLDSLNEKLRPKLWRELKPGTRIVSHAFRMGDWQPEKTADVNGRQVFFWTVPAKPPAAK